MPSIELSGKLGAGLSFIVDDEDFVFLSRWKWSLNNKGYVRRNVTSKSGGVATYKNAFVHKLVASRAGVSGDEIDHRDGNKLNNVRRNLRPATRTDNCRNVGLKKSNTSGFKGVCYDKSRGNYIASIRHGGKKHTLGRFATAEEASRAYIKAAKEHHGEFHRD